MKRLMLTLAAAGLLACFAGADSKESDAKRMNGDWVPSEAELGGEKLPAEAIATFRLTLSDDKYVVQVGETRDEGSCKIDPAAKPKTLDITGEKGPNKGKTILAIYELTDDSLRVCYDLEGKERPKEFKTEKNPQRFLVTYKRPKTP